ncbi:hypothetical protein DEO72_LG8g1081 [Vigna unguiculata]|uniref:Uncharacterized protein n=1 Tax=Vigna unguiculata TaxID=3917 RepID=A0A4D6MR27_VIGUN|nr:hypothetical protein DEO72_LG8g1081 [Vigna unguiculata]
MQSQPSVTNQDKSSHSEAFPFPNTTPLSQLRNCVWKENVTLDATIKTYLSLNEDRHVQNKRIQSTNRKPLSELTYCELDQNNGKAARRKRKLIMNQKLAEKSNTIEFHGSTSIGSTNQCSNFAQQQQKSIVQFDCHIGRSKTNLFNTQELLHKEIVGSNSSHTSLNCSAFSEVVNPFYVQQNQSHGVQFLQPSREQAIRSISKILDFDNNSNEDENDGNQ